MSIKENIIKVLKEGIKDKMIELIDSFGLLSAIKFVGGWDELKEMLGEHHLTIKNMVGFIKELARENNGLSVFDFDESPIFYNQTDTKYREITFFGTNTVSVQVWDKEDFDEDGSIIVRYENLDDEIIIEIFNFLISKKI